MRTRVRRSAPSGLVLLAAMLMPLLPADAAAQDHGATGPDAQEQHGSHGPMVALEPGLVDVRHDPERREIVALLGPFPLPATGNTMRLTAAEVVEVPVDGWLTAFETRILDRDGRELPQEILHHINVVRPDRRELFFPIMQRIAAAGQETGRIGTPFPFGVPASTGDTLLVAAMLHNPTGAPQEVVVEARFWYDTPAWLTRVAVQPFHLDIQPPPQGASFDLPPGRSEFAWSGSPAVDVSVLSLGGHIHAYGRELRLEELQPDGSSKVLWRTRPAFRDDGLVAEIPRKTFLLRFGLGLSRERNYRLVAIYENPTSEVIRGGGMAEIAGVVLPKQAWPAADHQDAWFHADYVNFTRHNPALRMDGAPPADDHGHEAHQMGQRLEDG